MEGRTKELIEKMDPARCQENAGVQKPPKWGRELEEYLSDWIHAGQPYVRRHGGWWAVYKVGDKVLLFCWFLFLEEKGWQGGRKLFWGSVAVCFVFFVGVCGV